MYSDDRQRVVVRISRAIRSARIEVQNARRRRRRGRPYRQLIPDDVTHIACKREVGSIADHGVSIWLPMGGVGVVFLLIGPGSLIVTAG